MGLKNAARGLSLGLALALQAACASGSNAWARHDRTADLKAAASDPNRECPVVVLNATDRILDASLLLDTGAKDLGVISAGQSVRFPVSCQMGRVTAQGVVQDVGFEGLRFQVAARLNVLSETRVQLTEHDQVRW